MTQLTLRATILLLGAIPFGVLAAPTISTPPSNDPLTGEVQTLRQPSDPQLGASAAAAPVLRAPVKKYFGDEIVQIETLIYRLSPTIAEGKDDIPKKVASLLELEDQPPTRARFAFYKKLLNLLKILQRQSGSKALAQVMAKLGEKLEPLEQELGTLIPPVQIYFQEQIVQIETLIHMLSPTVAEGKDDIPAKVASLLEVRPPTTQSRFIIYRKLLDLLKILQPHFGSKALAQVVAKLGTELRPLERDSETLRANVERFFQDQ
ncbi:hypothetical protein EV360DRAFT_75489, partial [Lentinula raphanica]